MMGDGGTSLPTANLACSPPRSDAKPLFHDTEAWNRHSPSLRGCFATLLGEGIQLTGGFVEQDRQLVLPARPSRRHHDTADVVERQHPWNQGDTSPPGLDSAGLMSLQMGSDIQPTAAGRRMRLLLPAHLD